MMATSPIDSVVFGNIVLNTGETTSVEIDARRLAIAVGVRPDDATEDQLIALCHRAVEVSDEFLDVTGTFVEGVYRVDFKQFLKACDLGNFSQIL